MYSLFDKNFWDAFFVATGVAAILQWIPIISGILTIVWLAYRVKEIRLSIRIKQKQLEE